jgi:hypothetical protein
LGPQTTLKPGVKKKDPAEGVEIQKLWPYPAIPPETQDLVRRTLEVAIGKKMTEAGVKGLVSRVKEGHQPEDYPGQGSPAGLSSGPSSKTSVTGEAPKAQETGNQGQPKTGINSPQKGTGASGGPGLTATIPEKEIKADSPKEGMGTAESLFWGEMAGVPLISRIRSKIKKGEMPTFGEGFILTGCFTCRIFVGGWKHVGKPGLKLLGKGVKKLFHGAWEILRGGLKNGSVFGGVLKYVLQMASVALVVVLIVWLAWNWTFNHVSPLQSAKRLTAWPFHQVTALFGGKAVEPSSEKTTASPSVKTSGDGPAGGPATVQAVAAPLSAVPVSPIPPKKTARTGPAPEPAIPEGREEEVEGDRRMIDEITEDLFKMSYQNYPDMIDDLKSHLDHDYEEEFLREFVPDGKIKELRDGWLYLSFGYSEPVKLLKVDDDSETFLAQGTVYTQSDTNAKVVHPRRKVAITIHVVHNGKKEGKVDEVRNVAGGN